MDVVILAQTCPKTFKISNGAFRLPDMFSGVETSPQ